MPSLPVRGGPADGDQWSTGGPVIVEHEFAGVTYFYRRDRRRFEYLGENARRCYNCEAVVIVPRSSPCPLCGASPETSARA